MIGGLVCLAFGMMVGAIIGAIAGAGMVTDRIRAYADEAAPPDRAAIGRLLAFLLR